MRMILFLIVMLVVFFLYYNNYLKTSDFQVSGDEVKEAVNPLEYVKRAMGGKESSGDETERRVKEALK